jgi:predicted transcriptional regulator
MKIILGSRIDPELKDLLQKLADEEDRSLSNFVVRALITYLKEYKGIDWRKPKK